MALSLLRTTFALLVCSVALTTHAQVNISGVTGWGSASQEYPDIGAISQEKPFGFTISFDLADFPSRDLRIGVEHSRSLQLTPFSSGLSFSLIAFKYYVFGVGPESAAETGPMSIHVQGFKPYLSGGIGVFQGVVAGATGMGLGYGGGAGIDWSLAKSVFLRLDGRYLKGTSNSKASLISVAAGIGFCL